MFSTRVPPAYREGFKELPTLRVLVSGRCGASALMVPGTNRSTGDTWQIYFPVRSRQSTQDLHIRNARPPGGIGTLFRQEITADTAPFTVPEGLSRGVLESGPARPFAEEVRAIDRIITEVVEEHAFLVRRFFEKHTGDVLRVSQRVAETLRGGHRLLLFGNGGSAADSQHIAAEFVGRFERDRNPLPAIALTVDTSILTAVANDHGYEQVFARQIGALGGKGDLAFGISTSGNSANVVEGIRKARTMEMTTVGLLGRDGGAIRELVDYPLIVDGKKTSRIQEIHLLIGHIICQIVEATLFGRASS
jgi:D-sedoheptulose 7-phosphate isomerase